jgi:hypothetical protein
LDLSEEEIANEGGHGRRQLKSKVGSKPKSGIETGKEVEVE